MKMKLVSVELKEGNTGFPYVVCQFQAPSVNKRTAADAQVITLNKTAPWNSVTDDERKNVELRNRKYKEYLEDAWINDPTAKTDLYDIDSWSVEVEPFIRKNAEGKWDASTVYNTINIYDFSDTEGNPLRGMAAIERRAQNMLANSQRLMTVADFKKRVAAAKQAAEKQKQQARLVGDDMDDADINF